MKKRIIIGLLPLVSFIACNQSAKNNTNVDEFIVNKVPSSCNCRIQNPKERPQYGVKHLGPYKTREEAIKAMCNDIDPKTEDQKKCWTTTPDNACKKSSKILASYDHFEIIRPLKQPKNMDCWATALTIMYSWKNSDNTIKIEDVVKKYGDLYVVLFKTNAGIKQKDEDDLYKKAKFNVIKGANPTIDTWYYLLKNNGPLSITVDAAPPTGTIHALNVNGITGDGTAKNTFIDYVDPADGVQHKLKFSEFILLYEGAASWPLQIIYWP
jgi:hypothetical protein